jgi:hypothetical protein
MAYAGDLKSPDAYASCGFDPHPGHHDCCVLGLPTWRGMTSRSGEWVSRKQWSRYRVRSRNVQQVFCRLDQVTNSVRFGKHDIDAHC